jgi:hypothetical protein
MSVFPEAYRNGFIRMRVGVQVGLRGLVLNEGPDVIVVIDQTQDRALV